MRHFLWAFLLTVDVPSACTCRYLTESQLAEQSVIFIGKVVAGGVESLRDDPWYKDSNYVRFEVMEALRGLAPGTEFVDLETMLLPGMCSPNPYHPGRTYLVTPNARDGKLKDGGCFAGRDVQDVTDSIEHLRQQLRNPQFSILGRVAAVSGKDTGFVRLVVSDR